MTNFNIIANSAVEAGIFTKEQVEEIIGNGFCLPLHTFAEWKRMGYSVKKGEKARMTCRIWKYTEKEVEQKEENQEDAYSHYFLAKAFFFTSEQVEKCI